MSTATASTNTSCNVPDSTAEKERRLVVETAAYLDTPVGETVPHSEVLQQAHANGYSDSEAAQIVSDGPCEVPERGRAFGDLWATDGRESDTEPLDDEADDFYNLHDQFSSSSAIKDWYLDGGDPVTQFQANSKIASKIGSLLTLQENSNWDNILKRGKRKQYRIHEGERRVLQQTQNVSTALLSIRISPELCSRRVDQFQELNDTMPHVTRKLKYDIERSTTGPQVDDLWYTYVITGTEKYGTLHAHVAVYVRGDIQKSDFHGVVDTFRDKCAYAPEYGNGYDGAIKIESEPPTFETERGTETPMGTYVANQVAFTGDENGYDCVTELQQPAMAMWYAAVDALSISPWGFSSNWPISDGEAQSSFDL